MDDIHDRLGALRRRLGLSLREMAAAVEKRGRYEVSHDSIRRYERGGTVPAAYVAALRPTFGVSGSWLLFGEGNPIADPDAVDGALAQALEALGEEEPGEAERRNRRVREQWRRFLGGLPPEHPLRPVILESWGRSRRAGVPAGDGALLDRIPEGEWKTMAARYAPLVERAEAHVAWLRAILRNVGNVISLVGREGIVVRVWPGELPLVRFTAEPGQDWSEDRIGTNGAGTALATGKVVAVVGAEHYREPFQDLACLASPIRGHDGHPVGVLDVITTPGQCRPEALAAVAYTALMIERDLAAS